MKQMSFCFVSVSWETSASHRPWGLFRSQHPSWVRRRFWGWNCLFWPSWWVPSHESKEQGWVWGLLASFLDAKVRFLALELTSLCPMFPSEVFPGAVQVLRLLPRAAGCRDLQPQHMALLQERTKPCHPGRVLLLFLSLCVSTSWQTPVNFYIMCRMIHTSILETLSLLLWCLIETTWDVGATSANSSSHELLTWFSFRFYIWPVFYPSGECVISH